MIPPGFLDEERRLHKMLDAAAAPAPMVMMWESEQGAVVSVWHDARRNGSGRLGRFLGADWPAAIAAAEAGIRLWIGAHTAPFVLAVA